MINIIVLVSADAQEISFVQILFYLIYTFKNILKMPKMTHVRACYSPSRHLLYKSIVLVSTSQDACTHQETTKQTFPKYSSRCSVKYCASLAMSSGLGSSIPLLNCSSSNKRADCFLTLIFLSLVSRLWNLFASL